MAIATATFTRPASATTYTAADHIGNSATGSAVTPMEFTLVNAPTGMITGVRCVVAPASGNVVITNFDFDLLLFDAATDIPFAAGSFPADNAALTVTAAAFRKLVAVYSFVNGSWRNPAGTLTAGAVGYQTAALSTRAFAMFNATNQNKLIGILQVKSAWDPGAVANQFDFALDYTQQ